MSPEEHAEVERLRAENARLTDLYIRLLEQLVVERLVSVLTPVLGPALQRTFRAQKARAVVQAKLDEIRHEAQRICRATWSWWRDENDHLTRDRAVGQFIDEVVIPRLAPTCERIGWAVKKETLRRYIGREIPDEENGGSA